MSKSSKFSKFSELSKLSKLSNFIPILRFCLKFEITRNHIHIQHCILGRFNQYIHTHIRGQNGRPLGVITTEGQVWAQQRRFALKHLRDLGFGKKSLDSVMIEEADQLIDKLFEKNPNGIVEIQGTFNIAIINVLWEIVASKRSTILIILSDFVQLCPI